MKAEQLCVDTMCYTAFPLERALAGIAEMGISRVELCASVGGCDHAAPEHVGRGASDKLLRLLKSQGLTAASFSAHSDLTTESGLIANISRLQLAADMEIPVLITGARPEQSGPEVEEHFRRNAVVLADLAAKLGVVLCLENLGFLLGTGEECAAFMQQLGRPNLRVNYDPAALMLLRGVKTTKDDIAAVAPYLAHFHFNDKASMKIGKMDLRPIGEGIVDWEPIISALDSAGYTGPASIEFVLEDEPESPEVVDDAVRRSVQFLQKYMSN